MMKGKDKRDKDLARGFTEKEVRESRKKVAEMERCIKEEMEKEKMDAEEKERKK